MIQTLGLLRTDYPDTASEKTDEEILAKFRLRIDDTQELNLRQDENLMAYLIICIRYDTDYQRLMQNSEINRIICNPGFNETEKIYLINQILEKHE